MKKNLLAFAVLTQLTLFGCATPAWKRYPMKVPPDYTCSYGGGEAGTDYFIWKCLDGKRVVIKQSVALLMTFSADKYESSCQDKTEIENKKALDPDQKECKSGRSWGTLPSI